MPARWLIAVVAAVLLLAACGGGDDGSTGSPGDDSEDMQMDGTATWEATMRSTSDDRASPQMPIAGSG